MPAIECPSSSFSFSSLVYLGSQEGFLGPTSTFGTSGVKETRTVYKLFETRVSTLEFTVTFLFLKKISPSLPKVKFTKTRKLPNPDWSNKPKSENGQQTFVTPPLSSEVLLSLTLVFWPGIIFTRLQIRFMAKLACSKKMLRCSKPVFS